MKFLRCVSMAGLIFLLGVSAGRTGALVTSDVLLNAMNNAVNPLFARAMNDSTALGYAVRFLVSEDEATGLMAKVGILRAVIDAQEYIPEARALPSDIASENLYEALLAFDLISSEPYLFTPEERDGIRRTCSAVLEHYLDPERCDWADDSWCLGVSALRIVASCALFSSNFNDDFNADRYLQHAIRYFRRNIQDGIDQYGFWVVGSPGAGGEAIEYIIITAKILRNLGFEDYFSQERVIGLLTSGIELLPPQQSPSFHGRAFMASIGRTDPGRDVSGTVVLAASDAYAYFPNESSYLVWYWNQCGNPDSPLCILFYNSQIPYMRPDEASTVIGGGTVIFRDRFPQADESVFYATFGDAAGVPDRERWDHRDAGDFSFVWSGIPVVFHNGYASDRFSDILSLRLPWRHSTVLPLGAGDTPVVPYRIGQTPPAPSQETGSMSDYYPDGLSQFMATGLVDYAAGPVSNEFSDQAGLVHNRHFLFIKPDALVIWDQVASPDSLEWDLWMPVVQTSAEGNTLTVLTPNGIELQTIFAGDSSLDYEVTAPSDSIDGDWPFFMRADLGSGSITALTIDCARIVASEYAPVLSRLLENVASAAGGEPVGLIDRSGSLGPLFNQSKIELVSLSGDVPEPAELQQLRMVIIHLSDSARQFDRLREMSEVLESFVRQGGHLVWISPDRAGLFSGSTSNPGLIPVFLGEGALPVAAPPDTIPSDFVKIAEDSVWMTPHEIPSESVRGLVTFCLRGSNTAGIYPLTVPPVWSDRWKSLATVKQSFPVNVAGDTTLGVPSRIRVAHPRATGFLTLLLPRMQGEPFRFKVTNHGPSFISFSDPVNTWEVTAGSSNWTDARLCVRMTGNDGRVYSWAFDATTVTLGTQRITAPAAFSIFYSHSEDRGTIQTAANNEISYLRGMMKLHAGEISFSGLSDNPTTRRESYLTVIGVVDGQGRAIPRARVSVNGSFVGLTDSQGGLPVPWSTMQPSVVVRSGDAQATGVLVPGDMSFVLDTE